MPRKTKAPRKPLTDEQIKSLVEITCRSGCDPEGKSAALLILLDEIEKNEHRVDVADTAKRAAFIHGADDHLIDAQVELLRRKML
jgi:hypothetical protein